MARISVYLIFSCTECSADQIREPAYNFKESFLSCRFVICHCRLNHMARRIQLMSFHQVGPAHFRLFDCKICIQISVRLLGTPDQIDRLIRQSLQALVSFIIQYKSHCFQPFRHICILEYSAVVLALTFSCGNSEVLNAMACLHPL